MGETVLYSGLGMVAGLAIILGINHVLNMLKEREEDRKLFEEMQKSICALNYRVEVLEKEAKLLRERTND